MPESDSVTNFIRSKVRTLKIGTLISLQWEACVWWLVSGLPGLPGMVARNIVLKYLFNKKTGFSWVQHNVTFVHCDRIKAGRNLGVNSGCYINALGGVEMGDYVLLGSNVTISSGRHPIEGPFPPIYARPSEPAPIKIGDDVWIGAGAVIMPGVTLATGTVVGANSVVTESTEPYSVVVGAPAKLVRKRT